MEVPVDARYIVRVSRHALLSTLVIAAAGCGPLRPQAPEPGPAVTARAESASALASDIRRRGLLPSSRDIADDAVLYTEMTRPPGERTMKLFRDTIRGGEAVARQLQHRQMEFPGAAFELSTDRVYWCDDATLQYGVYPMLALQSGRVAEAPDAGPGESEVWVPFAARWRTDDAGEPELDAIWLGPLPFEVRVGRLAEGCRDTDAFVFDRDYAGRRTGLELGVGYPLQLSTTGYLEDALRDHGWDRNVASVASPSVTLGGFYRLRPGVQIEAVASYQMPARVEATGDVFDATLEWSGGSIAGLVVGEIGRLRIGAGPAVAYTSWRWSDRVFNDVFEPGAPSSGTSLVPGAVAELGYIQTLRSRVYIHLRARYAYFADAEVPGFRTFPSQDVPMDRTRLTLGLGYWW